MRAMMLGGSRKISQLPPPVVEFLAEMMEKRYWFLVGDAPGADSFITNAHARRQGGYYLGHSASARRVLLRLSRTHTQGGRVAIISDTLLAFRRSYIQPGIPGWWCSPAWDKLAPM